MTQTQLSGVYNFRDLGGLPTPLGTTRFGALFRSDAPYELSDLDQSLLAQLGLRRVIDLRSPEEIARKIVTFVDSSIERSYVPIMNSAAPEKFVSAKGRLPPLDQLYRTMLQDRGHHLATAVKLIDTGDGGSTLVHCTAGKDRTGLVIALALSAVGVPNELIAADYAATKARLTGTWSQRMLAELSDLGTPIDDDLQTLIVASPASSMIEVLSYVEAEGGTQRYLLDHGMSRTDLEALTRHLVA